MNNQSLTPPSTPSARCLWPDETIPESSGEPFSDLLANRIVAPVATSLSETSVRTPPTSRHDSLQLQHHGFYLRDQLGEFPRYEWLIDGLLQEGTVNLLYGREGLGKSFFALHLCLCIATGLPMFGRETKPGACLYLLSEQPGWTKDRVEAWEAHHKNEVNTDLVRSRFALYADAIRMDRSGGGFIVSHERSGDVSGLSEYVVNKIQPLLDQPIRLIVIDLLSDSLGLNNIDEDDNTKVSGFIHQARKVAREIGQSCGTAPPAILLLHHPIKSDDSKERGAGALRGNCDAVFCLKGDAPRCTVTPLKQRSGRKAPAFQFQLKPLPKEAYRRHWLTDGPYCVVVPDIPAKVSLMPAGDVSIDAGSEMSNLRRGLELLHRQDGVTSKQWEQKMGLPPKTYDRVRVRLLTDGLVEKGPGKQGRFKITAAGRTWLADSAADSRTGVNKS